MKIKILTLLALSSSLDAATISWGSDTLITGNTSELITASTVTVVDLSSVSQDFYAGTTTGAPTSYGFTATDYETMLDTVDFVNTGNPYTISLTGLTLGEAYSVQVFYVDQRNAGFAGREMTLDGVAVLDADIGEFAIGTFTADAATQDIEVVAGGGTNGFHINGYIVATDPIPEPSSAALLGLGALALVARRKR